MSLIALSLLALAPVQDFGEITIRAYGTVLSVPSTPSAPFSGAAPGDLVEFRTTVWQQGLAGDAFGVFRSYPAYPGSFLRIGSASSSEDPNPLDLSAVFVFNDYPSVGDIFQTGMQLPGTGAGFVIDFLDLTGAVFSTSVLDSLRGTYFASDFDVVTVELREGCSSCVSVRVGLERLEIGLPESPVGLSECSPAVPNSTGLPAALVATGSAAVLSNDLTLGVADLPQNAFGFFLASQTAALVNQPGGSQGTLCLGGSVGRFGESVQSSGLGGTFEFALDLDAIAQPDGVVAALPGDTWRFQAWYRDANPALTSNFSDAIAITFQ